MKDRPNPDNLLHQIQKESERQHQGRLKIFLGYVAGVGKTYAMLQAAQLRAAEGVDVVTAYVETHGRTETEALLAGLEMMPRKAITHRGITLPEMDLDAVLARQPDLALVDELAHTNAPGSRHTKRYQDIQEMLNAGIDVYTTLNIQHLDSLNDIVSQITEIRVRETVPDWVLDEADDIALIDLPPDELLERLMAGKVYVPEQVKRATNNFFRLGNLTALREMAFRRAADRVDEEMRAYMQTHAITGPWPAAERIMVCVSPSPLSRKLIRTGRRLATRLDADWFAVYVDTGLRVSSEDQERVVENLHLAEQLGARATTITDNAIEEAVVTFARQHNVTKIVAGKPLRSRWYELLRGSPIERIIRESGDIDVYVINSAGGQQRQTSAEQKTASLPPPWRAYVLSTLLIGAATLLGIPFRGVIEPTNLVMFYLLVVVISALYLGRAAALLASILSVIAFNFMFVPPYYTYMVFDAQYLLTFAGLFVVSLLISTLAAQAREQAKAARRREVLTTTLYEFNRDLASAPTEQRIVEVVEEHVSRIFERNATILLPHPDQPDRVEVPPNMIDISEMAAGWVYTHAQPAGSGTDTLAGMPGLYVPLSTTNRTVGVLYLHLVQEDRFLLPDRYRLLESFTTQTAQAIERLQLTALARQAEVLREMERLQTALLDSISHDLRTPLVSITGALSSLQDDKSYLDEQAQDTLVSNALEQAEQLNKLVGNLLDMSRLESGAMRLKLAPCDIQDLIGVALDRIELRMEGRHIEIDLAQPLPLLNLDFVLMVQVLVNLLDNALKYSPPDSPVIIRARANDRYVTLEVADYGTSLSEQEIQHIFDKFNRGRRTNGGGTGLGLSISKGIVEAHGGTIQVELRKGETVFIVRLPLTGATR